MKKTDIASLEIFKDIESGCNLKTLYEKHNRANINRLYAIKAIDNNYELREFFWITEKGRKIFTKLKKEKEQIDKEKNQPTLWEQGDIK